MPEVARTLENAVKENWSTSRLAKALSVDSDEVEGLTAAFRRARQIVDAENPAELFRNAVRFSIQDVAHDGLKDAKSIEDLVTQICFRAADLAFVLQMRNEPLFRYSRHLRKESGVEYHEGYFDEPDEAV
jgi:hypothetical protein